MKTLQKVKQVVSLLQEQEFLFVQYSGPQWLNQVKEKQDIRKLYKLLSTLKREIQEEIQVKKTVQQWLDHLKKYPQTAIIAKHGQGGVFGAKTLYIDGNGRDHKDTMTAQTFIALYPFFMELDDGLFFLNEEKGYEN